MSYPPPIKREGMEFVCEVPDSARNLTWDDGRLYFMTDAGLCVMQGNQPVLVSQPVGTLQ